MIRKLALTLLLFIPFAISAQVCKDSTVFPDPWYSCANIPFQPVCGCDNVTYRNACAAEHWGGINNSVFGQNWHEGICDNFDFDFVPNPITAFSNTGGEYHMNVYINDKLLPSSFSVYIFDIFNRVKYQWDEVVTSNSTSGTPVRDLT